MHKPVDRRVGNGLWHQFVETARVQVRADGQRSAFIGGIDHPIEGLGRLSGDRKQPDVVDDDELGPHDAPDGPCCGVVGPVPAHESTESLEAEPADVMTSIDGGLSEGLEKMGLARARRSADHQVLVAVDPFEGVRSDRCVGSGIDDTESFQASKVLAVGNPAALRRAPADGEGQVEDAYPREPDPYLHYCTSITIAV
jgi:hypothetical protein